MINGSMLCSVLLMSFNLELLDSWDQILKLFGRRVIVLKGRPAGRYGRRLPK